MVEQTSSEVQPAKPEARSGSRFGRADFLELARILSDSSDWRLGDDRPGFVDAVFVGSPLDSERTRLNLDGTPYTSALRLLVSFARLGPGARHLRAALIDSLIAEKGDGAPKTYLTNVRTSWLDVARPSTPFVRDLAAGTDDPNSFKGKWMVLVPVAWCSLASVILFLSIFVFYNTYERYPGSDPEPKTSQIATLALVFWLAITPAAVLVSYYRRRKRWASNAPANGPE